MKQYTRSKLLQAALPSDPIGVLCTAREVEIFKQNKILVPEKKRNRPCGTNLTLHYTRLYPLQETKNRLPAPHNECVHVHAVGWHVQMPLDRQNTCSLSQLCVSFA